MTAEMEEQRLPWYTAWMWVPLAAFWLLYLPQTTLLGNLEVKGLYYPVYSLMVAAAVLGGAKGSGSVPGLSRWLLAVQGLLFAVIAYDALHVTQLSHFGVVQRLFIYTLALLTCNQLTTPTALARLLSVQIGMAMLLVGWVIWSGVQSGFAQYAGIKVNPNYITSLISFGLLPLFVRLIADPAWGRWQRLAGYLSLIPSGYAVMLLASRGVTAALAAAGLAVLVLHAVRQKKALVPLTLGVLLVLAMVVTVAVLPGGKNLVIRWSDVGNVQTLDGRVTAWRAVVQELKSSPPGALVLGHGLGEGNAVAGKATNNVLLSLHNAYLEFAFDFGLIGLALFVMLHLIPVGNLWREPSYLGIYGLSMLVFLAVINLTAAVPDNFLYWIVLGQVFTAGRWSRAPQHRVERVCDKADRA